MFKLNANLSNRVREGICSVAESNFAQHSIQVWKKCILPKGLFCIFVKENMYQCDHSQQTLLTPHGAADLRNGEFSCKCRTDGNWCELDKISSKFEQCSLNSVFSCRTGDDAVLWSLCNNGGWVKMNGISKFQQRRKQTVSPAASRRDSSTWSLEVQRIPWESKIETFSSANGWWGAEDSILLHHF